MKSSKALGAIAAAAFSVVGARVASATVITNWSFTSTVAPDNSPAPSTGAGTAVSLGMTNSYTYGGSETTPTATNDDITSVTGAVSAVTQDTWRIRGTNNKKGQPGNGWNNSAPNYTQGAEFEVSTAGFDSVNVSFDWFSTNQGVGNMQILYTLDDTAATPVFTTLGSDYIAAAGDFYNDAASEPNISVAIPAAAANDPNFAIEMVSVRPVATDSNFLGAADTNYAGASGGDYNNSSGNWSFNNISVTGTAIAVPEPASASLLGLAGLAILRRRRSR
ncbi:MAG TPA: PEP-CTERM sorting domain-containing protein [Tepidisphaeraceae bacterium]